MSLINCPECKNEISDKAKNCPKCAYPINSKKKKNSSGYNNFITIFILLIFLFSIYKISISNLNFFQNQKKSNYTTQTTKSNAYSCPMDCEHGKTYEKSGDCPICKMSLKVVKKRRNNGNFKVKSEQKINLNISNNGIYKFHDNLINCRIIVNNNKWNGIFMIGNVVPKTEYSNGFIKDNKLYQYNIEIGYFNRNRLITTFANRQLVLSKN